MGKALSFSSDSKTLAVAARAIKLWHLESRRELLELTLPMDAKYVQFTADGKRLLGGFDFRMQVWEARLAK